MNAFHFKPTRSLGIITISAILLTSFTMPARAEQDRAQQMQQDWAQHRQNWINAKLDKMAERLEIKSSQQKAWQAFAKVVAEEPANLPIEKADTDADAATMARRHADFATAYAKRLVQIADATTKLQETLTPEQRLTLNQMAHEFHHHRQHRHHAEHGDGENRQHDDMH